MTKKIYIIYTGGTLGMQKTEQGFRPVPNWFEQQLRQLPELSAQPMPEFSLHEYSPLLDSSDIHPEHWQRMAEDIYQNYDQYDGFVVLHGTDTMAYSAAALSYLLTGLTKPVIITGAQIPLSEPDSDTIMNVRNALYAAAYANINEVGLLFAQSLLKARYATKFSAQSLAGFASFNAAPLLSWEGPWLELDTHTAAAASSSKPKLGQINRQQVAVLTFHPGMNFDYLAQYLALPWDSVILHSFGAGNIPQHPQLWQALRAAAARGVRLINCTQCQHGEVQSKYASGYMMAELGVEFAGDHTLESTLAGALIQAS